MAGYRQVTLNDISRTRGGYILFAYLDTEHSIVVGKLGTIQFPSGSYAYLGSALGGFKSRIGRHINGNKKPRWHIDYLLAYAKISRITLCETERRLECLLAQILVDAIPFTPGFGSSDCRCRSHLFGPCDHENLAEAISKAIVQVVLKGESLIELTIFSNTIT